MASLSPNLRTFLNAARSLAATYVVAHHLSRQISLPAVVSASLSFGQEAVIVFFILSGFVIHLNEKDRVLDSGLAYYRRRLLRIYPTLAVAWLVSWVISLLANPIPKGDFLFQFLGNLFALQDISSLKPGVAVDPLFGNQPLWSISYEVLFYLAYPVIARMLRALGLTRVSAIVFIFSAVCLVTYFLLPNHFSLVGSYLGIWWLGAIMADGFTSSGRKHSARSFLVGMMSLGLVTCISLVGVWHFGIKGLGVFPFLITRHFIAAFVLVLVAIVAYKVGALEKMGSKWPIFWSRFASISYGLYVLHWPLLISSGAYRSFAGTVVALVALVVLATLSDRILYRALARRS